MHPEAQKALLWESVRASAFNPAQSRGFESDFPHNLSAIYIDSDPVISDDCVHIKAGNYRLLFTNTPLIFISYS